MRVTRNPGIEQFVGAFITGAGSGAGFGLGAPVSSKAISKVFEAKPAGAKNPGEGEMVNPSQLEELAAARAKAASIREQLNRKKWPGKYRQGDLVRLKKPAMSATGIVPADTVVQIQGADYRPGGFLGRFGTLVYKVKDPLNKAVKPFQVSSKEIQAVFANPMDNPRRPTPFNLKVGELMDHYVGEGMPRKEAFKRAAHEASEWNRARKHNPLLEYGKCPSCGHHQRARGHAFRCENCGVMLGA